MPLYEYRCSKCERVFEVIQKFADAPLTVHQDCGGAVERLLSAPAFQFKGSGWYITDYAKSGGGGKSNGGESKGGDGAGKTSESKPSETKSSETSSSSSSSGTKADTPAAKT